MNSKRYLERDLVVRAIYEFMPRCRSEETAERALKGVPDADVVERKKGKWHDCYHMLMPNCYVASCSSCGEKHEYIGGGLLNFCPNCGADMREDDKVS